VIRLSDAKASPSPDPYQVVRSSISLAHADRRGRVSVAGPSGLEVMIGLCREGFDRVECAWQATCSSADEASDVLLITGRLAADQLEAVLRRTCRLLRDGGVLVVQLARSGDDATVQRVLNGNALGVVSTEFDNSAGCLVSHTVQRLAALPLAG
jgi:hypothetical protein